MYFDDCKTVEELKKEYRRLAMIHHPDKGGDILIMQAINIEYDERLQYLSDDSGESASYNAFDEFEVGQRYKDIINRIINLPDIEIEICGKWIWVGGDTYQVREQLKTAGFFWASQKRKWYWRPPEQSYKRETRPMEWIRTNYGSISVDRPSVLQIGGD